MGLGSRWAVCRPSYPATRRAFQPAPSMHTLCSQQCPAVDLRNAEHFHVSNGHQEVAVTAPFPRRPVRVSAAASTSFNGIQNGLLRIDNVELLLFGFRYLPLLLSRADSNAIPHQQVWYRAGRGYVTVHLKAAVLTGVQNLHVRQNLYSA